MGRSLLRFQAYIIIYKREKIKKEDENVTHIPLVSKLEIFAFENRYFLYLKKRRIFSNISLQLYRNITTLLGHQQLIAYAPSMHCFTRTPTTHCLCVVNTLFYLGTRGTYGILTKNKRKIKYTLKTKF